MWGLPDSAIIGTARRLNTAMQRNGLFNSRSSSRGIQFTYRFQNLVIRKAELDFVLNNPRGDVGQYMKKRGRMMMFAAKQQVGVDTGELRDSIRMIHDRNSVGQFFKIGSPLPYALVHHQGSRPHAILARNTPFLRFTAQGRMIYTTQVMHPGTKPNRYLTDQLWMVKI